MKNNTENFKCACGRRQDKGEAGADWRPSVPRVAAIAAGRAPGEVFGEDFIDELGTSVGLWSARAQRLVGGCVEAVVSEQAQKMVGAAILLVSGRYEL